LRRREDIAVALRELDGVAAHCVERLAAMEPETV
jgi:hypothetical protein